MLPGSVLYKIKFKVKSINDIVRDVNLMLFRANREIICRGYMWSLHVGVTYFLLQEDCFAENDKVYQS